VSPDFDLETQHCPVYGNVMIKKAVLFIFSILISHFAYAQNFDIKNVNAVNVTDIQGNISSTQMRLFDMPPGIAIPGWSSMDINHAYVFYYLEGTTCTTNKVSSTVTCTNNDIHFTISNVAGTSVINPEADEYQKQTDSWGSFQYVFESFFDQSTETFQCLGKVKNSTKNAKTPVVSMNVTYKNPKSLTTILKIFTNIYPN
jgi:hypothetical protein